MHLNDSKYEEKDLLNSTFYGTSLCFILFGNDEYVSIETILTKMQV